MNIFGGNTGMTYDDVQRKRKIADAMVAQNSRTPRNVGEGLSAIGRALAGRAIEKRASAADAENRAVFNDQYGAIFGGGGQTPGGYSVGEYTPAPAGPNQDIADSAMSALGKRPDAATIKAGLVERGLPEHVADAFIMNFQDESGLDPAINERSPIVPGSRGGFGLAQWTGPRRKALEAFADQQGASVSDPNLQMDFLMTELQGSESKAAQSILSAPDAGSAAAAIVNDFLRPAEQHRARRVAEYTGGAGSTPGQVVGGGSGMTIQALAEAAGSPYASPGQKAVLTALLQQRMQAMDPNAQLDMQYKQAQLDAMRNPQQKPTATMQEYDLARSQGFDGTFAEYKQTIAKAGAGSTNVTVNGETGAKPLGTKGDILIPDPNSDSGYRVAQAGGSPAAQDVADAKSVESRAAQNRETSTNVITSAAQRAREAASKRKVGGVLGGVAAKNPSSQNAEVYRQVEVMKSNAKVENLNAMRAASKTGGALGAVTEKEAQMLSDKSGALDPASPYFLRDLDDYERTLLQVVHGFDVGNQIFDETRGGEGFAAFAANPDVQAKAREYGVTVEEMWEIKRQGQK